MIKNVILNEKHIGAVFDKSAIINVNTTLSIFVDKRFIFLEDKVSKTFSLGITEDFEYKIADKEKTNRVIKGDKLIEAFLEAGVSLKVSKSKFELLLEK